MSSTNTVQSLAGGSITPASSPSADKSSAGPATSAGTNPASSQATQITNLSSATSQLLPHVQPTQISSGTLSPTLNPSTPTPATGSLHFPSSSSTSTSQNEPHSTLTNATLPPVPTATSEGTSTTSLGPGQSSTQLSIWTGLTPIPQKTLPPDHLTTTTLESTSTTFSSQGSGSSTQLSIRTGLTPIPQKTLPPDHDHPTTTLESTSTTFSSQGPGSSTQLPIRTGLTPIPQNTFPPDHLTTATLESTSTTLSSQGSGSSTQLSIRTGLTPIPQNTFPPDHLTTATLESTSTTLSSQGSGSSTQLSIRTGLTPIPQNTFPPDHLTTATLESTSTTFSSQESGSSTQLSIRTGLTPIPQKTLPPDHGLPTTTLEGISTASLSGQGVGQSSTQLGSSMASTTESPGMPSIPTTTTIRLTSSPYDKFLLQASVDLSNTSSLSLTPTTPASADASSPSPEQPNFSAVVSANNETPTFPSSLTTTSQYRPTSEAAIPTVTVTKLADSRTLDSIIGGSIAAGIAIILLCALFFGLYLIRRRYKKADYRYKVAHRITPLSDNSYHPVGSTSAFVSEPLGNADDLEKQRRCVLPSAYVGQHSINLNPSFNERGSYPIQTQTSVSTFHIASLPPRGQRNSNVTPRHSCGSSFSGENYCNSTPGDFLLPYSQHTEHDISDMASNSDVGGLEAPDMISLSQVTTVPREPHPVQIGIAI